LKLGGGSSVDMTITSDGYLRMASGTSGIQFNGDTTAANALDDYEEGTWTPVLSDGTNDATTGADNGGRYTKIGNRVLFSAQMTVGSIGSVGANAHIKGLPFTSAILTSGRSGVAFGFGTSLNLAVAGRVVTGYVELNSTKIELLQWSAVTGTTSVSGTEVSDSGTLFVSGSYIV